MSTSRQPIWLIDPIDPPTEPVPIVREPLTEHIPVQVSRRLDPPHHRAAARGVTSSSRPGGPRTIVAVVLLLVLVLSGATAVVSAFLDAATTHPTSTSSQR